MSTSLSILQIAVRSPLSVRFGAIEMTALIIIITITIIVIIIAAAAATTTTTTTTTSIWQRFSG